VGRAINCASTVIAHFSARSVQYALFNGCPSAAALLNVCRMKLIVGLGNPGKEFEKTRHNVGFIVSNHLVGSSLVWKEKGNLSSRIVKSSGLLVAQPRVPMNSSGLAVGRLVGYFKIELGDLLVIHDDLDLELGSFKLQKGRGAAGHHGVESIIQALGSSDFWRLRVGIARPPEGASAEDYVLEKFGEEEWGVITKLVEEELMVVIREWVGENVK